MEWKDFLWTGITVAGKPMHRCKCQRQYATGHKTHIGVVQ